MLRAGVTPVFRNLMPIVYPEADDVDDDPRRRRRRTKARKRLKMHHPPAH